MPGLYGVNGGRDNLSSAPHTRPLELEVGARKLAA